MLNINQLFYVIVSLFAISVAALGIAYVGITCWPLFSAYRNDAVTVHAMLSFAAALALPVFFLAFAVLSAILTMLWALKRLFPTTRVPDFY